MQMNRAGPGRTEFLRPMPSDNCDILSFYTEAAVGTVPSFREACRAKPRGNLMILTWRGPGHQPPQERYSLWTRVGSITRALADVCVGEYPVSVVSVLVITPRWALMMSLKLLTVTLALVRSIIWEIWSQATGSRSISPIGIYRLSWAPWESSRMNLTEAGIETNKVKTNRINIFNILLRILELGSEEDLYTCSVS